MKIGNRIGRCICCIRMRLKSNSGFGMNELLGIAAALIIAAFIIIPQLKEFAIAVMGDLDIWWRDEITDTIFPKSGV